MNEETEPRQQPAAPPRRKGLLARIVRSHDFARDILVTTLGVLIALGIGEIVDEVRRSFRAQAALRVMTEELGLLHGVYAARIALQPCTARRLAEIGELLGQARETGRWPDVRNISYPPFHGSFQDSWELYKDSDVALHADPVQMMRLATLWANEKYLAEQMQREHDYFSQLALLEGRRGRLPEGMLLQAETLLNNARNASDASYFMARRDVGRLQRNQIPMLKNAGVALDRSEVARNVQRRNFCQPMLVDGAPYRLKGAPWEPRRAYLDDQ